MQWGFNKKLYLSYCCGNNQIRDLSKAGILKQIMMLCSRTILNVAEIVYDHHAKFPPRLSIVKEPSAHCI